MTIKWNDIIEWLPALFVTSFFITSFEKYFTFMGWTLLNDIVYWACAFGVFMIVQIVCLYIIAIIKKWL